MVRPSFNSVVPAVRRFVVRLRSRRFWNFVLVASIGCGFATVYEAAFRARLVSPGERLPTTIYSRTTSWRDPDQRSQPYPIGPLATDVGEYRVPVRLAVVPEPLIQAILAIEDQRFYRHHGLDFRRIAGAAFANLKSGGIRQGGSTITQQLAKNLFLSHRRTPLRKLREAAMAAVLEDRYDKATILEAYLNEIYLGQDGGDAIHGVGAAARYYMGKRVNDLTLGESALLAGMISAPNRHSPVRNPGLARKRRDLVLQLMTAQDRISRGVANRARREGIRTRPSPRVATYAPHFRDFAAAELARGTVRLGERGAAVYSTLDPLLQRAANRAVREGLSRLAAGAEVALVALDPRSGDILAMVGGRDYGQSQFNRATEARRQPGSAFKPVVALAALGRHGRGDPEFTLASVIRDEPIEISTPSGPWEPENYDREFRGPVTLREALEHSLNVPFARIGLQLGPDRIVDAARRLGITSRLDPVPSLSLGTSEVTPLELTRAYGTLASGGFLAETRALSHIVAGGSRRDQAEPRGRRVVEPAEAYLVTSGLEGVVLRGTGRGLADLGGWGGLAGKSGTSNNWRDAWFLAYTADLVVGVWVGYDDGRSLGVPGSRAALPIVARFLREGLGPRGIEPFPVPEGVELAHTNGSGEFGWVGWSCDGPREVFLEGTAPRSRCGSFDFFRRWAGRLNHDSEELRELIEEGGEELRELIDEHGGDIVRRLAEILSDRGRRAMR